MAKRRSERAVRLAIEQSDGTISAVAEALNVSRGSVYNYLRDWPHLRPLLTAKMDELVDLAEEKLAADVKAGDQKAYMFVLETKGKGRGWTKRQELTGADGVPLALPTETIAILKRLGVEPNDLVQQLIALAEETAQVE